MADFHVEKVTKVVDLEDLDLDLDLFSKLPETIIVHILSFLSTEEASRTSVLSKNWRRRWLFSDELDFDASRVIKSHQEDSLQNTDVPILRGRFFDWVNKSLQCHRVHAHSSSGISKLRFHFPLQLDNWYARKINEWVSYALKRRVQSLELAILAYSSYSFPIQLVFGTKTDLSFLISLSLSGVQVSKEDIDTMLVKFPFLEHLRVCESHTLLGVEVVGSSLALKYLEIVNCDKLTSIKVCNSCLVSLTMNSVKNLELENNSKLVSVRVSEAAPSKFHGDYRFKREYYF